MKITHIIWDFNGTVLDDVEMAVAAVNDMLDSRGLEKTNIDVYKDTLTMPLTEYYKTVGIYCNDIAGLSLEFRACCDKHAEIAKIADGVREVIDVAKNAGITNVLMSSLYHPHLLAEVEKYGISDMFDEVIGLPDRNLGSKKSNALAYLGRQGIDAKNVLFIGDLISDAQMAQEIGAKAVLISNGHMSFDRCKAQTENTYDNIKEIIRHIQ